jgi:predicted nuclease of predicted toxin-antitoxin system
MGTLSSELRPLTPPGTPRIYADANIPSGVVTHMRERLSWDVFFVLEHDQLRRARDIEHYHLARQLARTLVTLDRDYEDDRRFPPGEGPGVIVFAAPDERRLCELLTRVDRDLFRAPGAAALPIEGRKIRCHPGAPPPPDPGAADRRADHR